MQFYCRDTALILRNKVQRLKPFAKRQMAPVQHRTCRGAGLVTAFGALQGTVRELVAFP